MIPSPEQRTFVVIQQRLEHREGGSRVSMDDPELPELIEKAHDEGRAVFEAATSEEASEIAMLLGDKEVKMFPLRFKRL